MSKNILTKQEFMSEPLDWQLDLWNQFCEANRWENMVVDNDMYGYSHFYGESMQGLQDLARAIHYGDYRYTDKYCTQDGYGNLYTFTYEDDFYEHVLDIDEFLDWFNEGGE
jgi:hypothetical protein